MRVRNSVMVLLGVLVMVLPFLGLPGWMKTILFVVLGFVVAVVSYFSGVAHRSGDMTTPLHSSSVQNQAHDGVHPQA